MENQNPVPAGTPEMSSAVGTPPIQQTIIMQQEARKSNALGTAGFILALLGLIFCWVPVFGWIMWFLGLIFSFIGIFKSPKGLAITGLIISLIDLIILIAVIGAVSSMF